jgi:hypothetical protein
MRRLIALTAVLALSLSSAPLFAAGATRAARAAVGRGQNTGTVNGTAKNAQGQNLPNYTVRIRNLANGNIVGSSTTNAAGDYSFIGLPVGNYAIEIVNAAGDIIGTSASIAVAAGATVSVTVTASAATAIAAAAAAGGGISTALIITAAAITAGVVGVVVAANNGNASASR